MENFDTLCVHPLGENQDPKGSVSSAIYPSTAYNYIENNDLQYPGFYSTHNQKRLAQILARLEGGIWGVLFSSGMAAITTAILTFVESGDHIILSRDLYGGTLAFVRQELSRRNVSYSFADNTIESYRSLVKPNTKLIYIETPANPLLNIVPLKQVASLAKTQGLITVVDNTFASPINQQPLALGIDISVHSGTKYLGGHNDLPFGALVSNKKYQEELIYAAAKIYGGSLAPTLCYMVERSLKTLSLRIERQNVNAEKLTSFLNAHPSVERVFYPGLPSHPGHELAKEQMGGFGGMLSFELDISSERVIAFMRSLKIIQPALSLGGVESLICVPAATSHRNLSHAERAELGIKDNLFRLSVGIEDADDLINDLKAAISAVT